MVDNDYEMTAKHEKTTNDEFSFMRKEALIFLNDLKNDKNSLISRELKAIATPEQLETIKTNVQQIEPIKSIDVSPDQFRNLKEFVASGEAYPPLLPNNEVDYDSAVEFMRKLGNVFKWRIYEKKTLGYVDATTSNFSHIKWYSNILYKWMSGYGLSSIILSAIKYKDEHPETGIWANNWKIEEWYNKNDPKHKNLIIADTLNTIENVILFSVANYLREFSAEYKLQHGNEAFDNDWYEYVEYGTTKPLTILLQRYGYHREAASYIMKHKDEFVDYTIHTNTALFALKKELLLNCSDESTKSETPEIAVNIPELFV